MSSPTTETQRLMAAAADLRAGGAAWEFIAATLRRNERSCRRWVEEHPKLWRKLLAAAEKRQEGDARAEARVVLRKLLRGGDEKSRLAAAQQLLKRPLPAKRPRGSTKLSDEDAELAAYISIVRGMSDDEIHERARTLFAVDDDSDGRPGPPGAAAAE